MELEPSITGDLDRLSERVSQALELVRRLRAENDGLRAQVAQAEAGDRSGVARGEEVRQKLVALLQRLEEF